MQRNDDEQERSIQAEKANRSLEENVAELKERLSKQMANEEAMKGDYESRLEEKDGRLTEAERVREEAETKCERLEQVMALARRVHSRELEQLKKEKTESEKKLRREMEDLKKSCDKVMETVGIFSSRVESIKGLYGNL